MKLFKFILIAFMLTLTFSCQKSLPLQTLEEREAPDPPYYNLMNYNVHGDLTLGQYIKKARYGMPTANSAFYSVLIQNITSYRNSLGSIKRGEFDTFLYDLNTATYYVKNSIFNGFQAVMFRGRNSMIPNLGEYKKFTNTLGQVMVVGLTTSHPTLLARGPSLNVDVNNSFVISNGGPYKLASMSNLFIFKQQGSDIGHYELVPKNDMLESTYLSLINNIQLAAAF